MANTLTEKLNLTIKPLISDEMSESLSVLVGYCYNLNRLCDGMIENLAVDFSAPNLLQWFHEVLSHAYPILGDSIADYAHARNTKLAYPETMSIDKSWADLVTMFQDLFDYEREFETAIFESVQQSNSENDGHTYEFLLKLTNRITKFTEQIITLHDKAVFYNCFAYDTGDGIAKFDHDFHKFFSLKPEDAVIKV